MDIEHQLSGIGIHLANVAHVVVVLRMEIDRNTELKGTETHVFVEELIFFGYRHPMVQQVPILILIPFLESLQFIEHRKGVSWVAFVVWIDIHIGTWHIENETDLRVTLVNIGAVNHIHQIEYIQHATATCTAIATAHHPVVDNVLVRIVLHGIQFVYGFFQFLHKVFLLPAKGDT